jgi:hypothetical protein
VGIARTVEKRETRDVTHRRRDDTGAVSLAASPSRGENGAQGDASGRAGEGRSRHGRGTRSVTTIRDLRDPLDSLIMEGQVLVERLRRASLRPIAELGDSAERVLLTVVTLDVLLGEAEEALVDDDSRGADDEIARSR